MGDGAVPDVERLLDVRPAQVPRERPADRRAYSIPRFIMVGTVIPFVMYVVGRYTFDRTAAVRVLLWTILALAAYSAAVSILQFTGPTDWVWPRFIVDGSLAPTRPGSAGPSASSTSRSSTE